MKRLVGPAVFLVATTLGFVVHAEGQEIRACDFAVKARCVSGDARVTVADGKVKRVEVGVFSCGLPGRPGYTCTIDSSRGDADSTWSEDGSATVIVNKSPFNEHAPDRVKVTVGHDVSINLDEAQSLGRCGVGAELPRAIVIPARKRTCRVWLGTP